MLLFILMSRSETTISEHTVYRELDQPEPYNFAFGYYMATAEGGWTSIDARMFAVEFFSLENEDKIILAKKSCSFLNPASECLTNTSTILFNSQNTGLGIKVRQCRDTDDLPEGQKCFEKEEREKYYREAGYIRIFPFYEQKFAQGSIKNTTQLLVEGGLEVREIDGKYERTRVNMEVTEAFFVSKLSLS